MPRSSIKSKFFDASTPIVIGHRGSAGTMPENTILSFDQALKDGADVLETDVHLTKDGEIVLIHDKTVDRISNGSGNVADYTLEELKKLDAAYHFSLDGGKTFPCRGQGSTIPTLREVFERYDGVKINVDLKSSDPLLVDKVLELVKEKGRAHLTALGSFHTASLKKIRKIDRKEDLGILTCASKWEAICSIAEGKMGLPNLKAPYALEVPLTFKGVDILTKKYVKRAHANGHFVAPWTINDPIEMMKLLKMGVDGLITDYPGRAAQVIKRFKNLKP